MNAPDHSQIEELLELGVADGVITAEQATSLRRYAGSAAKAETRTRSLAIEALGYLGGAIALAGMLLIGVRFWGDLGTGWRCAVLGAGTVVPLVAGAAVPAPSPGVGARLRSVLWLVSLGAFAGLLAVLGERALDLGDSSLALLVAGGCAAYAAALWAAHRTVPQQVVLMVAIAVAAHAALDRGFSDPDLPGLGVWCAGVLWIALGRAGLFTPARLALAAGSAMLIFGALLTAAADSGMILALVSVAGVVAGALVLRDLVLLAVGALGAVATLPGAMTRWFPDSVAAAVGLIALGLLLVVAAASIAVRRRPGGASSRRVTAEHVRSSLSR